MNAKKLLLDAMGQLISSKSLSRITVQDVLDRAEVSRYTFYKYFRDKYDLANAYYEYYVSEKILSRYDGHNWPQLLTEILSFVRDNRLYFINIIKSDGYDAFSSFLESFSFEFYRRIRLHNTGAKQLSDEEIFKLNYLNGGCCYVFFLWLNDGCRIPPETLSSWMIDMSPDEFITYLD